MKSLYFHGKAIEFDNAANIAFENDFYLAVYDFIYGQIVDGAEYGPLIDADKIHNGEHEINLEDLIVDSSLSTRNPSPKATNRERLQTQMYIQAFFDRFPLFAGLLNNCIISATQSIKNAESLLGQRVDSSNFIEIKGIIDEVNRSIWNRDKDVSEAQSGVSTLGTISETLLKIVFEDLVDDVNFFKVNQSSVQSYGDFVLTCLPNNLWLSVKSNFARERLLASGYTNDILGVGFFQDATEFIGEVRIRNFQRAGFLAMYCPDVPVSEKQIEENTNTFDEIHAHYQEQQKDLPTNINGKPFIRKLSEIRSDLMVLLEQEDIRNRTTVSF